MSCCNLSISWRIKNYACNLFSKLLLTRYFRSVYSLAFTMWIFNLRSSEWNCLFHTYHFAPRDFNVRYNLFITFIRNASFWCSMNISTFVYYFLTLYCYISSFAVSPFIKLMDRERTFCGRYVFRNSQLGMTSKRGSS